MKVFIVRSESVGHSQEFKSCIEKVFYSKLQAEEYIKKHDNPLEYYDLEEMPVTRTDGTEPEDNPDLDEKQEEITAREYKRAVEVFARNREKRLLLKGIETLQKELDFRDSNLDAVERMLNLVSCLVALNWKEVGRRESD